MPLRRRAVCLVAICSVLVASACQTAAPAAPSPTLAAEPTTPAAQQPTGLGKAQATAAPPTSAPNQRAAQPTSPPKPPTAPKPSPTSLPTLPTTSLASLSDDQARAVREARNALPAGDFTRAIGLVEPLLDQLKGDQQAEVRLVYGQALVGDRQFGKALATSETLLTSTTRADLISAARLLKGQALRGLERFDEAATEMRAVAESNPLVAAGVRL